MKKFYNEKVNERLAERKAETKLSLLEGDLIHNMVNPYNYWELIINLRSLSKIHTRHWLKLIT